MNKIVHYLLLILALLLSFNGFAQNATIKASCDSTQLWIGEQTKIHIEVSANKDSQVDLLLKEKTLMPGVEILERSEPDTTDIGNNRIRIQYDYLITSFEEDLYSIPSFRLAESGDTILSNEIALKVMNVPIDTTGFHAVENINELIYDIKDVKNPPFVWKDYINYLLYPFLVIILILLILLFYFLFTKKKPIKIIKKEEPKLPAHVIAIKELDEIKSKKLWQQGKQKEYHSEITDTLRSYIERRFLVSAMEMTSNEILDRLKGVSDADNVYDKLKQILLLADLVKFAKYNALPDEHELSLLNAYLFVNNTKIEEVLNEQAKPEEETENKNNDNK